MAGKKKKKLVVFSRLLKFFSFLIAFAMVTALIFTGAVMYFNSPVQDGSVVTEQEGINRTEDGAFYIDVRRGESAQSVGLRLERAKLIKSSFFWNLICRLEKEHIKIGTYRIEIPASPIAIHRLLVSGRQILYRVTIPEGVTLKKMAAILEEAGICSAEDFLNAAGDSQITGAYRIPNATMEGYLFPDTYLFQKEYPAEQVIKTMADNFYRRIENIDPSVVKLSSQELNEKVILASIVEREYRVADEAPLMAGVFFNRLRINMALQSCATVEYIITEIQDKPHPAVIYNRDLEIRDPYNTYLRPGLPPGPISAPGIVALQAVLFPEKTDFFYFRLNDPANGRHYFSRTLDEHISAGELIPKGRS
ncbi:MAG: endolytic transglycosylase MltG [Treponema sp.]|nr:endolytic transglycosylase MltG [Treponema sp.]